MMAPSEKCLLCMHEDGILILSTMSKAGPHGARIYSQHWADRDRRPCFAASIPESVRLRFNEGLCIKEERGEQLRKTPNIGSGPHMHARICVHINKGKQSL